MKCAIMEELVKIHLKTMNLKAAVTFGFIN